MAEELAPHPSAPSDVQHEGPFGTFPAGTAVLAFVPWFFLARLVSRLPAEHPVSARIAMITGTAGTILAVLACFTTVMGSLREQALPLRAWTLVRAVLLVPLAALVASALRAPAPMPIQTFALLSVAATVFAALTTALVRARGMWLARATLLALMGGELIELFWPSAHYLFPADSRIPTLFNTLGGVSEALAFVGAPLALVWSIRATLRSAGPARTRMFMPLPVFVCLLVSMLATSIPSAIATAAADVAFGTRFDLLFRSEQYSIALSTPELLVYLLIPELVFCAAVFSLAAVTTDRGAGARRMLGWLLVLFAGFGKLRLVGPIDPIRLSMVALGALLLERAVVLERDDRG